MPVSPADPQGAGRSPWLRPLTSFMVLFALSFAAPALAQESETANPGGIPAEAAQAIDAELARTTSLFADVQRLEAQAAGAATPWSTLYHHLLHAEDPSKGGMRSSAPAHVSLHQSHAVAI